MSVGTRCIGLLVSFVLLGVRVVAQESSIPDGVFLAAAPLSQEDLFRIIVQRRAETFNPGGAPLPDVAGIGRRVGADADRVPAGFETGAHRPGVSSPRLAGDSVFAVVQATDREGRLIDLAAAEHVSYAGRGAEHAESRVIRVLEKSPWSHFAKASSSDRRGGTLTVLLDQFPCQDKCAIALREFAARHEMGLEVYVPTRSALQGSGDVSPRTAARTAQRIDVAGSFATRFARVEELSLAAPRRLRRTLTPPPALGIESPRRRLKPVHDFSAPPGSAVQQAIRNIGATLVLSLLTDWIKSDLATRVIALNAGAKQDTRPIGEVLRDPRNAEAAQLASKLANGLPNFEAALAVDHHDFGERFDDVLNAIVSHPGIVLDGLDMTAKADQFLLQYDGQLAVIERNLDELLKQESQALAAAASAESLKPLVRLTPDSLVRSGVDGNELVQLYNFLTSYPVVTRKAFENVRRTKQQVQRQRGELRDLGLSLLAIERGIAAGSTFTWVIDLKGTAPETGVRPAVGPDAAWQDAQRQIQAQSEAARAQAVRQSKLAQAVQREAERQAQINAEEAKREAERQAQIKRDEAKRDAERQTESRAAEAKREAERQAHIKAEEAKRDAERQAQIKRDEAKRDAERQAQLKTDEARRQAERQAQLRADQARDAHLEVERKAEQARRDVAREADKRAEELRRNALRETEKKTAEARQEAERRAHEEAEEARRLAMARVEIARENAQRDVQRKADAARQQAEREAERQIATAREEAAREAQRQAEEARRLAAREAERQAAEAREAAARELARRTEEARAQAAREAERRLAAAREEAAREAQRKAETARQEAAREAERKAAAARDEAARKAAEAREAQAKAAAARTCVARSASGSVVVLSASHCR